MQTIDRLSNMKKVAEALVKEVSVQEGKLEQAESQMQEAGYSSVEEARTKVQALKDDRRALLQEAEDKLNAWEEEYADYI